MIFKSFLSSLSVILPVAFIVLLSTTLRYVRGETTSSVAEESLQKHVKDTHHLAEHLAEHFGMDEAAAKEYLKNNDENAQYFLMHDDNNDSKLDGLEILQSLSHHQHANDDPANKTQEQSDDSLVEFVDMILSDQDLNKDGYVTYPEFVTFMNQHQQQNGHAAQQGEQH